ncbi:MAG TPA: hypothetical protein VL200_00965 [Lacunisphaera sp.]|nr:hypothetical protein [Lacunisphaera sp.]
MSDPGNTAVDLAIQANQESQHLVILKQWADQLQAMDRQLRQLEDQLAAQRRIRDVLGNPSAVGISGVLRDPGATGLPQEFGETLRAVQRVADATASLRRTAESIYQVLDDRTVLGQAFVRQPAPYKRYAAVELQSDNLAQVFEDTGTKTTALQKDLAATLAQLANASTQAEVDKLNTKVAAINGQLAHLAAARRDETDKLLAQQVLNENQAAKERQDFLEKQIAEERQTLTAVGAWQAGLSIKATEYSRP